MPSVVPQSRLRVITNYLTRMRYCTAAGALDLESKGPTPSEGVGKQKVSAWFSHNKRRTTGDKILFGTDYPFTTVNASVDGLRKLNDMLVGTALPRRPASQAGVDAVNVGIG